MPRYDGRRFDPPAPTAEVVLRSLNGGGSRATALLLIDTGADVTLIPRAAVEAINVEPIAEVELIGFDGGRSAAKVVELEMQFLRYQFRGRYVLVDADSGVLGRDVLSRVVLVLNGPKQEWNESP